jgi:hypothetical protein
MFPEISAGLCDTFLALSENSFLDVSKKSAGLRGNYMVLSKNIFRDVSRIAIQIHIIYINVIFPKQKIHDSRIIICTLLTSLFCIFLNHSSAKS